MWWKCVAWKHKNQPQSTWIIKHRKQKFMYLKYIKIHKTLQQENSFWLSNNPWIIDILCKF